MRKINLDKEELYQKYITECLSQQKVADYFGVSVDTVAANLRNYGIQSHKNKDFASQARIVLNEKQQDYLTGALLGDGCLVRNKNGVNAQFCYTSKSFQHVSFVSNPFSDLLYKEGIKHVSYRDKRTDKVYSRYTMRTVSDKVFTNEYDKWYKDGIKHIPKSLRINPTVCLIWYIGDGCICHSTRSESIKLSTQCFQADEQESILLPQLDQFSPRLMKGDVGSNGNRQYHIYIPRTAISDFLNYIGICPFSDYAYKWETKPYKNFVVDRDAHLVVEMIELFKNGKSSGTIAKELGIDRTTVVKYLSLNGLNYKDNLNKRGD